MIFKRELLQKRQRIVVLDDTQASIGYFKSVLNHFPECDIKYFMSPNSNFFDNVYEQNIDLFIMDIKLGNENGIKISEEIICKNRGSIFLFVSGFEYTDEDFKNLNGKCIYDFLSKPIDVQCLITVVTTLLNVASSYKLSAGSINQCEIDLPVGVEDMRRHYLKLLEEDKLLISKLKGVTIVI